MEVSMEGFRQGFQEPECGKANEQRQHNEAKTVCSTNVSGTIGHAQAKNEFRHELYTLHNN